MFQFQHRVDAFTFSNPLEFVQKSRNSVDEIGRDGFVLIDVEVVQDTCVLYSMNPDRKKEEA